ALQNTRGFGRALHRSRSVRLVNQRSAQWTRHGVPHELRGAGASKLRFSQGNRIGTCAPPAPNSSRYRNASNTSRRIFVRNRPPNAREVPTRPSAPTAAFGRLHCSQAPALTQFHAEPRPDERCAVKIPNTDKVLFAKRTEPAPAAPTEVSFGPF